MYWDTSRKEQVDDARGRVGHLAERKRRNREIRQEAHTTHLGHIAYNPNSRSAEQNKRRGRKSENIRRFIALCTVCKENTGDT